MLNFLFKKLQYLFLRNITETSQEALETTLSNDLNTNLKMFKDILGSSSDIIIREITFGHKKQARGALLFIEGLADKETINKSIIKPLMYDSRMISKDEQTSIYNIDSIKTTLLSVGNVRQTGSVNSLIEDCLSGNTCKD